MMTINDIKLKPCPFCGCEMQVTEVEAYFSWDRYRITGNHILGCFLWDVDLPTTDDLGELDEIGDRWNERA